MNKTSLAKAIGIMFGIISAIIALGFFLLVMDKSLAAIFFAIVISLMATGIVVTAILALAKMVYDAIGETRYD